MDPFSNIKKDLHVVPKLLSGVRPEKPDFAVVELCLKGRSPDVLWELMQICWERRVDHRPPMSEVARKLLDISA